MRTFVVGCNHRTAPIEIREKLAFDETRCRQALARFSERFPEAEVAILSTCNRTELYLMRPMRSHPRLPEAIEFLADQQQIPSHEFSQAMYHYEATEAVRHLFRVVSSLDSMVVGESGILGQAKRALEMAKENTTGNGAPRRLDGLFQKAFSVSKEIHTRTEVSAGRFSVGSIAVDFARQIFSRFDDKCVLMIGAGEMGELTLTHLLETKPRRVMVTNRTAQRAEELAARIGAEARPFEQLVDLVVEADIVLTCTGSPQPIITRERFASVPAKRRYRPLLLIDMAVPRDVEPEVGRLQGVFACNIDDLQQISERQAEQRKAEITQAERIIEEAVLEYVESMGKRDVGPVVSALAAHFERLAAKELAWLDPKLKAASEKDRELIEQMTHRLIKKILHEPTRTLHTKGQAGLAQVYAEILQTLFRFEVEEGEEAEEARD